MREPTELPAAQLPGSRDARAGALIADRLWPGNLILTGTPAGVGMARRRFLRPGDTVTLCIEGIGDPTNAMHA